jgi:hypothetical protein
LEPTFSSNLHPFIGKNLGFNYQKQNCNCFALAAVAAASTSFAQVSLTGEFAYGYLATTSGTGATASGGGLDTAQLVFAAGEDLGGGNRVDVTFKTDGSGGRGAALTNDDQIIELTTGFGKIKAGSWKPGDWLSGVTAASTWYGLDGRVLSARSYRDSIGVAVPLSKELTLSATAYEPAGALGEGSGNAGQSSQSSNVYGLNYKTGPVSVSAGYVTYNNQGTTDATAKEVSRVGGNYDFGAAKVGLGYQVIKYSGGGTNDQALATLSAPLAGPLSANLAWASNKADTSLANGTRTGYMTGLQYNLSKRTYTILNYGSWTAALGDSYTSSLTALTLVHDF